MNNYFPPKFLIIPIAILSVLCFAGLFFAQEAKAAPAVKEDSSEFLEQARNYREEGLKLQSLGDLPKAMSFYQKAIAINPGYAIAYNDLGVIYEAMGSFDLAEENYLSSIKIDPMYSSAYTNLALFYEGQRNLEKAAVYWSKRAELGIQDGPWTQKAIDRLRDVRTALSNRPITDQREAEVLSLIKDESVRKSVISEDDQTFVQYHFKKAKLSYNKGDMATAIKEALDAQYLDQDNPEIEAFIEKAGQRALTR